LSLITFQRRHFAVFREPPRLSPAFPVRIDQRNPDVKEPVQVALDGPWADAHFAGHLSQRHTVTTRAEGAQQEQLADD
jgi:hypothetical protein